VAPVLATLLTFLAGTTLWIDSGRTAAEAKITRLEASLGQCMQTAESGSVSEGVKSRLEAVELLERAETAEARLQSVNSAPNDVSAAAPPCASPAGAGASSCPPCPACQTTGTQESQTPVKELQVKLNEKEQQLATMTVRLKAAEDFSKSLQNNAQSLACPVPAPCPTVCADTRATTGYYEKPGCPTGSRSNPEDCHLNDGAAAIYRWFSKQRADTGYYQKHATWVAARQAKAAQSYKLRANPADKWLRCENGPTSASGPSNTFIMVFQATTKIDDSGAIVVQMVAAIVDKQKNTRHTHFFTSPAAPQVVSGLSCGFGDQTTTITPETDTVYADNVLQLYCPLPMGYTAPDPNKFCLNIKGGGLDLPLCLCRKDVAVNAKNLAVCTQPLFNLKGGIGRVIIPWVEHHLNVGVDHFFIFHRPGVIDTLPVAAPYLKKKVDEGLVTLIQYPGFPSSALSQEGASYFDQIYAQMDCLYRNKNVAKWAVSFDLDENLILPAPHHNTKIPVLFSKLAQHTAEVHMTELQYGASIQEGTWCTFERQTTRNPGHLMARPGKYFYSPSLTKTLAVHWAVDHEWEYARVATFPIQILRLHHYSRDVGGGVKDPAALTHATKLRETLQSKGLLEMVEDAFQKGG